MAAPVRPVSGTSFDPDVAIRLRGVQKSFGNLHILKGMDLDVPANSIFGFLGSNGSGKTTTMNILTGLNQLTEGTAEIFGLDVRTHGVETRALLGFLRQDPRFYTWMTPRQTLAFTGKFFGLSGAEIDKKTNELLDLVELREARDRKMGGFSGGMRQRLGIAQALVGNPRLVILDEPVSALDPQGRYEVIQIMERLRGATTIFYSTHILQDVERIADQIGIVCDGKIAVQGPLEQLVRSGKSALVVEFEGDDRLVIPALRQLPFVTGVAAERLGVDGERRRITLQVTDIETARRQVPRIVVDLPVIFERCGPEVETLEDLFLSITGGYREAQPVQEAS
jgi:ABC-2 type transport system ATP-binding protein